MNTCVIAMNISSPTRIFTLISRKLSTWQAFTPDLLANLSNLSRISMASKFGGQCHFERACSLFLRSRTVRCVYTFYNCPFKTSHAQSMPNIAKPFPDLRPLLLKASKRFAQHSHNGAVKALGSALEPKLLEPVKKNDLVVKNDMVMQQCSK